MAMCIMAVVAVPMLVTRREPDHVTGPDFPDQASPAHPAVTTNV
jgi:hypothetical protein